MNVNELYSSEFLNDLQKLNDDDGSHVKLFCKLLVAFFGVSFYKDFVDHKSYKYDSALVNKLMNESDPQTITENAMFLEIFFKTMFKVKDKNDPRKNVTLTGAIVDTFTKLVNLSAAISSLKVTSEFREHTAKEKNNLKEAEFEITRALGTRNHIINELIILSKNRIRVLKKAETDELDLKFVNGAIDFLNLLLQFDESN